jgi:hypothetical protein
MMTWQQTRPPASPRTVKGVTPEQRIALWAELVDACERVLIAGLRRRVGDSGDVRAAYRDWYARQCGEHETTIRNMLERLNQAEARHAR